jgi:hypothetical protein
MSKSSQLISHLQRIAMFSAIAVLAACGGGGSDRSCVDDPLRNPALPSCSGSSSGTVAPAMTLTLADAAGIAITTVSPTSPGFVQAKVKDSNGNVAPNVAVTFTTTDTTGGFTPPSGSALTDVNGIARVTLLAGSTVGAYTMTATTPGTSTGTVGSGGTVGIVPAATATLGYAVNVASLATSALGSIKFVSAEPTAIALKGTGGVGRQEFSVLTFQVFDQTAHPVQGRQVNFTLNTTVGGLSLQPQNALTDVSGKVSTVVSAGTIPTPVVIVTASVPSSGVTTVSNVLVLSTGLAITSRISLSVTTGNCEGWDFDGDCTPVTLRMGDHFGNPVVDGTAVSFSSSHGFIDAACVTGGLGGATSSITSGGAGECSATLRSAGKRPANGRVVVIAYVRGEEDFFDANGNNICDGCTNTAGAEFKPSYDLKPDLFRDDNENGSWSAGEPCISPSGNATCATPPDGMYNGVLASPKVPDAQQTIYLGRQYVAIWSGSHASITATQAGSCAAFSPPGSGTVSLHVRVVDVNGNPMPAGTTIDIGGTQYKVSNYVLGVGQQFGTGAGQIPIEEYDVSFTCATAGTSTQTIKVKTPRGIETSQSFTIL